MGRAMRREFVGEMYCLMVNNTDVKSVSQFEEILAALPRDRPIPLLIQRRGAPTFLALKLAGDKDE